ncbi:tellurite resistance TerB family protein [Cyanobium sp. CH-040]|uniref:tellurite resistance TerB family protein n=1 Tax=Cyanobium sp. CH-040 TaxID=2823708 RepID=UPI0020CDEE5E|nr:tellurite resistance TerB family protein [Cyanobium sp. CH-040]MCP9928642.1 tellurite resistance TerB family protein [Cyanobium sp. CH-040]
MNQAEAFATIPVAAVASDRSFVDDEARLIREQLLRRTPFRSMALPAFGELFSGLLLRLRDRGWQELVQEAAPLLQPSQRETAFALAAQLIHCDRDVTAAEIAFLEQVAGTLELAPERRDQILEVCALLNADCLA